VATDQAKKQTKLARDVAKRFNRLRPSEARVFALAVPPGFYSAVARLAALFPDDPAEKAPTIPTERIKRAAPSIPTRSIRVAAKKAPTLPKKRIGKMALDIPTKGVTVKKAAQSKKTTAKKAAQSKKMSRG
jgi:hypothetical protein